MDAMASQITSLTIFYSTVYSGTDQRKHQSSMLLAFVQGIHGWPHEWPVTRKTFSFHDVITMATISHKEIEIQIFYSITKQFTIALMWKALQHYWQW